LQIELKSDKKELRKPIKSKKLFAIEVGYCTNTHTHKLQQSNRVGSSFNRKNVFQLLGMWS